MKEDARMVGTFKSYLAGFIMCIILTLAAYFLVSERWLSGWNLILSISGLGIIQFVVQLIFFLHLGKETRPHWNFLIFLFMGLIALIIVAGSLWIMYNLNERVMTTDMVMSF